MLLLIEGLGADVRWTGPRRDLNRRLGRHQRRDRRFRFLAERIRAFRSCSRARCSRGSGRYGCRPPGGGRDRAAPARPAPSTRSGALGATVEHEQDGIKLDAPTGLRPLRLPDGRAVGDGDRETRLMAAAADARPDRDPKTLPPEPHVARTWRGMLVANGRPQSTGSARNVMTVPRQPAACCAAAAAHESRPDPHRDRLVHGAGRLSPGAS